MQNVSCPSCGAPVQFKSHASVMAVCEFCRATVVKDEGSVRDLGKMSSVIEDYSRIQVGTEGRYGQRQFAVVGRIQLRYAAGMWNEWYLLFDDGSAGWLGDSSGMYVVTTEHPLGAQFPAFEMIRPGRSYDIGAGRFTASEKRVAECVGGQGELPFKVGQGWQAKVADFRQRAAFATLDYSDGDKPVLYVGTAVTLEQMQCQLLRDDEQIKASAGKYRGRVESLSCPSCGNAVNYVPGLANNVLCQSCHSQLDTASAQVQVLAKGEQMERVRFTLPLGATGKISGKEHRVIGAMVRADEEDSTWTEYLLYSTSMGFLWLVETEDGWSRASVMPEWPLPGEPDEAGVRVDAVRYGRDAQYSARVVYAAGAFNWQVKVGDTVRVSEFAHGQTRLAAELSDDELTWSRSTPVAFDQVATWFGMKAPASGKSATNDGNGNNALATKFLLWLLGLNLIPLLANFSGTILWLVFGALAIVLPTTLIRPDE